MSALDLKITHAFRPYGLLAELTYRCPLHCPYCSNPTQYPQGTELATDEWTRVFREAAELGVLHVGLSGGEPLQRTDLSALVSAAREAGLYSNLITSAIGLSLDRARELKSAGLDSIQVSFQSDDAALADTIAGTTAHALKREAVNAIHTAGIPLSLNVVLHRANIDRIGQIIALAEELRAERIELASTQYYGWAFKNMTQLLPSRAQIESATRAALAAQERLKGRMEIVYVVPDYFGERPKPCMNGWGRRMLTVNPIGQALPCPTAGIIPGLVFDNVRDHTLRWIWTQSPAFNRFRGTEWMQEPCRSCEFHDIDFGGCRCQAALLTGDPDATDPACSLSPKRSVIEKLIGASQTTVETPHYEYRV
jgi:pyrroloquinoline quinone biosynthesis protein E